MKNFALPNRVTYNSLNFTFQVLRLYHTTVSYTTVSRQKEMKTAPILN